MPDPLDWPLLDRYLAGEASPAEQTEVHAKTKADPAWAEALAMLRSDFSARPRDTWNVDSAWSRTRPRLAEQATRLPAERTPARPTPVYATTWFRIAAAVLVVAGTLTTWRLASNQTDRQPDAVATMNDIVTPNGTRQTITLGDGSRVTLNAGSRLRWGTDFGNRTRDVYLDGEAYFAVSHDRTRPFRVHTRNAVAHDLGTRFTVRAYPELPHVEVVVAEGAVSLRQDRPAADSAILGVGQLGRLGESGSPIIESNIPMERWTAWTGGALVLEGLTLAEAVPQLERWYDATIRVADSRLAQRRVAARFHDETLSQMLDALTLALGARWEQSGRTITLTPAVR